MISLTEAIKIVLETKVTFWSFSQSGYNWKAYWISYYEDEDDSGDPPYRVEYIGGDWRNEYECEGEIYFPEDSIEEAMYLKYKLWPYADTDNQYIASVLVKVWGGYSLEWSLAQLDG